MIQGRDIVVLAYLSTKQDGDWTIRSVAADLGLDSAGVHRSVRNLVGAGLLFKPNERPLTPWVLYPRAINFLTHAVRPYFPPVYLGEARGVPAAWSAPPLADLTTARGESSTPVVWPYALGNARGTAIEPVHKVVPEVALNHPKTGELLALVDAIRYGHGRILSLASELIASGFATPEVADEHKSA